MLAAVEPLGRELTVDLFLSIKEDNVTRGIPNDENIAEVAPTFKNNGHYMKLYETLYENLK